MATILTKKSDTASAVPLAADLTNAAGGAELAVNATDKRLFSKTSGGTVVELGTNPSTLVLPSGSANGVAYLNGSKVVTSGSALTFDGTNFGIGAATALKPLDISFAGTSGARRFLASYDDSVITIKGANASNDPEAIRITGDNIRFNTGTSGSGSEVGRFTSTGLGIGTSSPAYKLTTSGSAQLYTSAAAIAFYDTAAQTNSRNWIIGNIAAGGYGDLTFSSSTSAGGAPTTQRMTLDYAGNLGLGVTPSAGLATANYRLFEIGLDGGGSIYSGTNQTLIGTNIAWSGGTPNYKRTGSAPTLYNQQNGAHSWSTAPSGTAGNAITFTQAMTLDASGNLGINNTSPSTFGKVTIQVSGTTTPTNATNVGPASVNLYNGGNGGATDSTMGVFGWQASNPGIGSGIGFTRESSSNWGTQIRFYTHPNDVANIGDITERARIDSSGKFLVNTTSTVASGDEIAGFIGTAGISAKATGGSTRFAGSFWNDATTGDNVFLRFYSDGGTERGSITYNRAGGLTVYNTTSDYRAKDIYGPVTGSGALIDSVPVYMGKMKGATQERPMFIAHETPEYAHTGVKDAVDADGNPVYQQMDASALIPVMWAEIQSLRKRLADAGL